MTRHKHAQTGLVTPSLPQHWLTAMLRVLAMLVLNVVSTLQMIRRREAVNVTQPTPTGLPRAKTDTRSKETIPAVPQDSPSALILSSTQSARPSKDEGVLTTVSHTTPTPPPSRTLRVRSTSPTLRVVEANRAPMQATKGNCLHHFAEVGRWMRTQCADGKGSRPALKPLEA